MAFINNIKQQDSEFLKFFNRHFHVIIYCAYFFILMFFFYQGKLYGLFTLPGTDSSEFHYLQSAKSLLNGNGPPIGNPSPLYVIFLGLTGYISYGNIILMRIIQAAICSFIPVYIYKLSRRLRTGRENAQIAAMMYCLYGASALTALSFTPFSLLPFLLILFIYFVHKGFYSRRRKYYLGSILAGTALVWLDTRSVFIVVIPFLSMLLPQFKNRIAPKRTLKAYLLLVILATPAVLYHGLPFSFHLYKPALKLAEFASSYELTSGTSLYMYYDIIDFAQIFIIPFNLLLAVGVAALFFRERMPSKIYLATFAILYSLIFPLFSLDYNCRSALVPLLCTLSGLMVISLKKFNSPIRIASAILFICIFSFYTYRNPDPLRTPEDKRHTADILIASGRWEKAANYLDKIENQGVYSTRQWYILIRDVCRSGDIQFSLELEYRFLKHFKKRTHHKLIMPIDPFSPRNQSP